MREKAAPFPTRIPPQVLPFALFMLFIAGEEALHALGDGELVRAALKAAYPAKTACVALLLILLRKQFLELRWSDLRAPLPTLASVGLGVAVFLFWIRMDWGFATIGAPAGYDPHRFGSASALFAAIRLFGAAAVVPIMEELFWRSFLLRYLIAADWRAVPVGAFGWSSFLLSVLLFGLEHNLYLAGMMAGAFYNLLLYRTKSLAQCVLCHAVTNFALGIYVLSTGRWQFW